MPLFNKKNITMTLYLEKIYTKLVGPPSKL